MTRTYIPKCIIYIVKFYNILTSPLRYLGLLKTREQMGLDYINNTMHVFAYENTVLLTKIANILPACMARSIIKFYAFLSIQQTITNLEALDVSMKSQINDARRYGFVYENTPIELKTVDVRGCSTCLIKGKPTPIQEILYLQERIYCYAIVTTNILVDTASGNWRNLEAIVPSDEELFQYVLGGPPALYIVPNNNVNSEFNFILPLTVFDYWNYFSNIYLEVRAVYINTNKRTLQIKMRTGEIITDNDIRWNSAKLYLSACLVTYMTSISHSWVHFHFADIVCASTYTLVPENTVFYKLMKVHCEHTFRTGAEGLSGVASDGQISIAYSSFIPNVDSNVPVKDFNETIQQRSLTFYGDKNDVPVARDVKNTIIKFNFPPEGLDKNHPIDYVRRLSLMYDIFYKHIDMIYKSIPETEYLYIQRWKYAILKYFPQIDDKCSVIDMITTFVWMVSILHSTDHETTYRFVKAFNIPAHMRRPFNEQSEASLEPNSIMVEDILKHLTFADNNLKFTAPPGGEGTFEKLEYNFEDVELNKCSKNVIGEVEDCLQTYYRLDFEKEIGPITTKNISTSIMF